MRSLYSIGTIRLPRLARVFLPWLTLVESIMSLVSDLKSSSGKTFRFCVVTQVWRTIAAFHVSFQFNDWLFGALYFVFHARDVIKINHYWEKYTASLPSFHIKEQNRWEISSLEQNYKVTLSRPIGGWAEISRSARKSFTTVASTATRHNCEKPNLLIRIA